MSISPAILSALRQQFGDSATTGQLWAFDKKVGQAAAGGALQKISRGVYSLVDSNASPKISNPVAPTRSVEELKKIIAERFDIMGVITDGVISGNIRSLMISGAAGVGKTYELEQRLDAALLADKIKGTHLIKGSVSAIGLYCTLFENRKKGQVLILDDADVFDDEQTMNILKGALDTSVTRKICWNKASSYLADAGIPQSFNYEGQVVFLTNIDVETAIEKNNKNAPHLKALVSRSVFLDLGIHTNEQILIRIEQVLATSKMASDLKLSPAECAQLVGWMQQNINKMRSVSLRSVIQAAGFMKTTSDWQRIANATMLKGRIS